MAIIGDITLVGSSTDMYGMTLGLIPTSMVIIRVGIMVLIIHPIGAIILIMALALQGGVDRKRMLIIVRLVLPLSVVALRQVV